MLLPHINQLILLNEALGGNILAVHEGRIVGKTFREVAAFHNTQTPTLHKIGKECVLGVFVWLSCKNDVLGYCLAVRPISTNPQIPLTAIWGMWWSPKLILLHDMNKLTTAGNFCIITLIVGSTLIPHPASRSGLISLPPFSSFLPPVLLLLLLLLPSSYTRQLDPHVSLMSCDPPPPIPDSFIPMSP